MTLIGTKVKHKIMGLGTVTFFDGARIHVKFAAKEVTFVYPDAFETFIKAEDPSVQDKILEEIQELKLAKEKEKAEEAARKKAEEELRQMMAAASSTSKKKSLDERFGKDYNVVHLKRHPILTYEQVENQFGIRIAGFGRGINPTDKTVVLISSIGKSGESFVYHDKWTVDGDYIYSGEGKTGDQKMTRGNLAIKNAASEGKEIHLFVKFSPQEYYYQGVFELVKYTYEDDKDEDGNIRKEYKFLLRKVS
jgi:hypothetical protein